MKSLVGKIGTLALVAMAGVAVIACSSEIDTKTPGESSAKNDERIGTVGLSLRPVAGITINTVRYTVTAGNAVGAPIVSEGDLPTPGTSDNFSFGIPLPVGTGYYISLSGVSVESPLAITCTGSMGPFNVTPNTSTQFAMVLTCTDVRNGQIITTVDVKTDACPRLVVDYALAEPGSALIGGAIAVRSNARDLDSATAAITYAWSVVDSTQAGVGQFAPANLDDTTFTCLGSGDSVKIKVTADNGQCKKSLETVVSCVNEACGDGVVDTAGGETCDPGASGPGVLPVHPADPGCPSDCTKVCGDGVAEGSEACDPLPANPGVCNPAGSAAPCTLVVANCGDGLVTTPAEACDTLGNLGPGGVPLSAGSTCNAGCGTISGPAPVVCGDGNAVAPEQCDAGTGTNSSPVRAPSRVCSGECESVSTAACVTCEQAGDCFASSDNCLGPAAAPFTTAQTTLCFDVMQCIQTSNCLDGTGSLGKCYCGSLDTAACGAAPFNLATAGAPNGPCAALMQQGNPAATTNSAILGGLTTKSRPGGAAGQRLNCQKNDAACAPICGVE